MTHPDHSDAYRFLAELLLYPQDRDVQKIETHAAAIVTACPPLRQAVASILADVDWDECDVYLQTFEIAAKAPLYLGHYLYEEPTNCRGAAISGRNGYMIQLKNLYGHFGLELKPGELPDFLPLMLDFLALTAEHADQKRRRWMIKAFMRSALPQFCRQLREAKNVYSPAAEILEWLIAEETKEAATPQPETKAANDAIGGGREEKPLSIESEIRNPRSERPGSPRPLPNLMET